MINNPLGTKITSKYPFFQTILSLSRQYPYGGIDDKIITIL